MWDTRFDERDVKEIRTKTTTYLGVGAIAKMDDIAADLKARGIDSILCVTGGHSYKLTGAWDDVTAACAKHGIRISLYDKVTPNPTTDSIDEAAALGRSADAKAVFCIGGVGGYAVEALVRSGVGAIDLIDDDKVCLTNLNRQIIATRKTVGKYKVDVMEERIHDINPECKVTTHKCFYLPETKDDFDFSKYSYVIDAVDTVTAKLQLVMEAQEKQVPVISSMGAGNKLNPAMFEVADIYKTSVCPLAKVMRREMKKRGVKKLKVVYSKEKPLTPGDDMAISCRSHCVCPPGTARKCTDRRQIPGSISFVPSVVGLIIAGEVIKDLVGVH